jgi:hypothetical protein
MVLSKSCRTAVSTWRRGADKEFFAEKRSRIGDAAAGFWYKQNMDTAT